MVSLNSSILTLFITSFYFFIANSQNVNIHLCPLNHDDISKSMVCVSKADGTSLYEYVLTEYDIENGSEYHISLPDPLNYCFSIINEYKNESINEGNPFYSAKTFYGQIGDLNILRLDHPIMPTAASKDHMSSITINNAPLIEHWDHQSGANVSTFKQTGAVVKAQANFEYSEDVFIVIKGTNDKWHRYIYIENDQPPITGGTIPIKSYQSDWKSMPSDLSYYSIPLPFNTPYKGFIKAFNANTGNYCVFFSGANAINNILKEGMNERYGTTPPKIQPEEGIFDLFLPPVAFTDYNANVTWGNWRSGYAYNYRIYHGDVLKFPYISESNFVPDYVEFDSLGFKSRMNGFPDNFRIFFTRKIKPGTYSSKQLSELSLFNWIVIGKNSRDIQFNIPVLNEANKALFPASGEWRYEHFENVEFLEKDPNIDWINFFHDFNVLLVSYRDPFK